MAEAESFTCHATLADVRGLAEMLQRFMAGHGVPDEARIDLELALVEAANNIVLHGYDETGGHMIEARLRRIAEGIEIILEDSGQPIPDHLLDGGAQIGPDAESGRGLSLIAACTDRIDYASRDGRNRLILFKAVAFPMAHKVSPSG